MYILFFFFFNLFFVLCFFLSQKAAAKVKSAVKLGSKPNTEQLINIAVSVAKLLFITLSFSSSKVSNFPIPDISSHGEAQYSVRSVVQFFIDRNRKALKPSEGFCDLCL